MPSGSRTIIVGGGIEATAPFSSGALLRVTNVSPPRAGDSILSQAATATPGIIVTALGDPNPTGTERVRLRGGLISEGANADSTVLGRGAVGGANDGIAIGRAATLNSTGNVAIGLSASANTVGSIALGANAIALGNESISIGNGTADGGGGTGGAIRIGRGATAATGQGSIAIGLNAVSAARATAVGESATANASGALAIGALANTNGVAATAIGGFNTAVNVANQILIAAGSSGSSIAAGTGASIGIGGGGISITHADNILIGAGLTSFQANTAQLGGPSTVINTLVLGRGNTHTAAVAIQIRGTNASGTNIVAGDMTIQAPRGTGNAATGGEIIFNTGTPGASGTTIQPVSSRLRILKGGAANGAAVQFDNVTDGAGAGAGTLTNAPSAGDPSFWLPIVIQGVGVRYVPCWT